MRKVPIYLVEKYTGLKDTKGVDLYYAVVAKLTREAAERQKKNFENTGTKVRVRKLSATK